MKIRNEFYHMDVTWDAGRYKSLMEHSYEYFALTDEEISLDHSWDRATTPACVSNEISRQLRDVSHADNDEQLDEIIKGYRNKQTKVFRIKLSGNVSLPNDAGEYLAKRVLDGAVKSKGRVRIRYNWNDNARYFFGKIN